MLVADLPLELLLIRVEVITGGLHEWAAKGISASALIEPNNRGFPWLIFLGLPSSLYAYVSLSLCMYAHSTCVSAPMYACVLHTCKEVSCVVLNFASNKRRTWFLFFSSSKLGHELYSAASNYQPCERIEGERRKRGMKSCKLVNNVESQLWSALGFSRNKRREWI